MTFGKGHHLQLIDGSAYIFRAYHALPPLTRKSDGLPVGAVAGFCNILWQELTRANGAGLAPSHIAVVFDHSAVTFRNEIYDQYKAHRPAPPEDLIPQFPLTRKATRAFNVACLELEGYEADDIIATLARQAVEAGGRVTIISSDKDLMQLVNGGVVMRDPMKDRIIDRAGVQEKFGVPPERVVDVQAILGDSVDNVPGAKGIGAKSAPLLVAELGSIDEIFDTEARGRREAALRAEIEGFTTAYEARLGRKPKLSSKADLKAILLADHPDLAVAGPTTAELDALVAGGNETARAIVSACERQKMLDRVLPGLLEQEEIVRISKRLVTLDAHVALPFTLDELEVRQPDPAQLLPFLAEMEFRTLTRRVAERLKVEPPAVQEAPPPAETPAGEAAPVPFDTAGYECVRTAQALTDWIAAIRDRGWVAIDTETTSLDEMRAEICGISLAVEPGRAAYVPVGHRETGDLFGGSGLVPGQLVLEDVLRALKPVLEDPSILKIGQNIKYDWKILARLGIRMAPIEDTMLMSYAMHAGLHNHGMDGLSETYLGHVPVAIKTLLGSGKSAITFERVKIDDAVCYAAEDADVTLRLWRAFRPQLHRARVTTVYETLERPLVPVLADMEMAGIQVDRDTLSRMSNAFSQKMAALEDEIQGLVGRPFNVGSPKQLGEILFDEMGLPGGERGKAGAWNTGADVLEDITTLEDQYPQGARLAARILDWRQLAKLKSTYTDTLQTAINPETGRVHTSYSIAGANTGRLASTDPNLQNIPVRTEEGRRIREAFVAPGGRVLVSLDYSQIELRILAHMAEIPQLRQAFHDGIDIHALTASEMFGVPLDQMTPEIRRRAKAINFGVIYGISGFGLARNLRIPRADAQAFIDRYFERFPGIRGYMDATVAYARANGHVKTLFGRRIHTPEINAKGPSAGFARRAAINAPIQGTAADIIRRAMVRMPAAIAGLDAKMLLQVHDELLFEVAEADVEPLIAAARSTMEAAAHPAVSLAVPLVVDAGRGANWAEAH